MGNLKQLSHSLSWGLRHKAMELGWTITRDGYVPVDEILLCSHAKFRGKYSVDDIRQVVASCDKQRYKLAELPVSSVYPNSDPDSCGSDDRILCIRANQGHSITVIDPLLLLHRLTPDEMSNLPMMVHGTSLEAWSTIQTQGLNRMTRNHIHFAKGLPNDSGVMSGMRKSCQVLVYIDIAKCASDSVAVYQSDNGVLLTAGVNDEGTLPVDFFLRVTDGSGAPLLWPTTS